MAEIEVSRRGRPPTVSITQIVAAAVELIDAVGVDACTMRALADRMAISPMTLYRHVADKQELLGLIPDVLLAEVAAGVVRKRKGISALRAVGDGLASVLISHPGSVQLFDQPQIGPNMARAATHVVAVLSTEGLPPEVAAVALRAVVAQVLGEMLTSHEHFDRRGLELLLDGVQQHVMAAGLR